MIRRSSYLPRVFAAATACVVVLTVDAQTAPISLRVEAVTPQAPVAAPALDAAPSPQGRRAKLEIRTFPPTVGSTEPTAVVEQRPPHFDVPVPRTISRGPFTGDITVTSLTVSPTTIERGGTLQIGLGVDDGLLYPYSVGYYQVGIYLSSDAQITTADRLLGIAGSVGDDTVSSFDLTLPFDVGPGTYTLGAYADIGLDVSESNESNNSRVGATLTIPSRPDLISTGISGTCEADGDLKLFGSVFNQGDAAAGAFEIGLYASTDGTITTGDIRLGSVSRPSLGSGELHAFETVISAAHLSKLLALGTYTLGMVIDDQNQVTEILETNNTGSGNSGSLPCPVGTANLINPTISATCNADGTIQVSGTVSNTGSGDAGPFRIGIYASADATIDTSDTLVAQAVADSGLPAGFMNATYAGPVSQVFSGLPKQTYTVGAIVDDLFQVGESNESDNVTVGNMEQFPCGDPDLQVTTVTGACQANGTLSVSVTVTNAGTTASLPYQLGLYASSDGMITPEDPRFFVVPLGGLAPGAQTTVNLSDFIYTSVARGDWTLGAIADDGFVITEQNEGNNALAGTTLGLPCPALGACAGQAAGLLCRASTGPCDVAEVCNGSSWACPADGFLDAGTRCGTFGVECRVDDVCDGAGTCVEGSTQPFTLTKVASRDPAIVGGLLEYILTATNTAAVASNPTTIADDLPADVSYLTSDDGCVENLGAVSCPVPSLGAGATSTARFLVEVDPVATPGELFNSASVCAAMATDTTRLEIALFFDGFESGDTSGWIP